MRRGKIINIKKGVFCDFPCILVNLEIYNSKGEFVGYEHEISFKTTSSNRGEYEKDYNKIESIAGHFHLCFEFLNNSAFREEFLELSQSDIPIDIIEDRKIKLEDIEEYKKWREKIMLTKNPLCDIINS